MSRKKRRKRKRAQERAAEKVKGYRGAQGTTTAVVVWQSINARIRR